MTEGSLWSSKYEQLQLLGDVVGMASRKRKLIILPQGCQPLLRVDQRSLVWQGTCGIMPAERRRHGTMQKPKSDFIRLLSPVS
jgi:hypothetical protein